MKKLALFIVLFLMQFVHAAELINVKGYSVQNAYFADTVRFWGFKVANTDRLYDKTYSNKHCGESYMNDKLFVAYHEGEWYLDAAIENLNKYEFFERTTGEVEVSYNVRITYRSLKQVKGTLSFLYYKDKYETPFAVMVMASSSDPDCLKLSKEESVGYGHTGITINNNPKSFETIEDELFEWQMYDLGSKTGCSVDRQVGAIHVSDITKWAQLRKRTATLDTILNRVKIGIAPDGSAIEWNDIAMNSFDIKGHEIYMSDFVYVDGRKYNKKIEFTADEKYCHFDLINKQVPAFYYSEFEYKEVLIEQYPMMKATFMYNRDTRNYFYNSGNAKGVLKKQPFITTDEMAYDFSKCILNIGGWGDSYLVELYYAKVKLRLQEVENQSNFIETEYLKPIITKIERRQ